MCEAPAVMFDDSNVEIYLALTVICDVSYKVTKLTYDIQTPRRQLGILALLEISLLSSETEIEAKLVGILLYNVWH